MAQICPPPPPPPLPPQDGHFPEKPVMPLVFDIDLSTVVDMTKAKNIAVHKIDKSIWHLQDSDRILKRGPNVKVSEAEALRTVASSTHVPVPVIGTPLHDVLHILDTAQVERVITQLSGFVRSWMGLRGDYFGSRGFKACRDVFFQHLPAANMPDREYGPFRSLTEYCTGLSMHFVTRGLVDNSMPTMRT
ncbi:uncharacterized protein EKO05_0005102 [Ascochyta rabiei]|uniref:ATP binding n=1 Tax=Didymella rabiei TaxID=5454 RepID=A0A162X0C2_DIDRA|nr:uncharacterized protein EKO05_0005102 [Ascochyta rabiei]KZM19293.1 ATP binding [Ascochyta rabiei]UPX14625.1 hypothetical protein EKO05_0005102 [Ascochyta rabiei]